MEPREPSRRQEDMDKEYTCCKGFLIYGGLQRSVGQLPRCLGLKKPLPNVVVTEEDIVPPPPEDARFIFVGIGVSVYNREMLLRNRLPLVNGFSQLITSKNLAPEEEKASATRRQRQQQQRPAAEQQRPAVEPAGAAAAGGGRVSAAVPVSQAAHKSGDEELTGGEQNGGAQEWEKVRREDVRDQIKAVVDYGRTRVQKQFDVSVELARIAPGKLRHAASVQVAKAQEMPGILLSTNKRMIESGSKYVRDFLAEQEKKK